MGLVSDLGAGLFLLGVIVVGVGLIIAGTLRGMERRLLAAIREPAPAASRLATLRQLALDAVAHVEQLEAVRQKRGLAPESNENRKAAARLYAERVAQAAGEPLTRAEDGAMGLMLEAMLGQKRVVSVPPPA